MTIEDHHRDPERTRTEILNVAIQEFASRGFSGARVDEIASMTRTTKRMIYYYFGSKELLYAAALEKAYDDILVVERGFDVRDLDPVLAIRRLAEVTFDRHEANPDLTRLVGDENVQWATHAASGGRALSLDRPVIKMLHHALDQGRQEGIFLRDIDVIDVYMLISSFCFYRINNRYTFEINLGRNLVDPERRSSYRKMIGDVVVAYLTSSP